MRRAIRSVLVLAGIACFVPPARAQSPDPIDQMARDIFKQLIEINTTDSVGNVIASTLSSVFRTTALTVGSNVLTLTDGVATGSGSFTGNVRHITASISVKIAVFAPMPNASDKTTTKENCQLFRMPRIA